MKKLQARARVKVTLDIAVSDTWGPDCLPTQIFKQATESALNQVRKLTDGRATVLGTPQVTMIFVEEEER